MLIRFDCAHSETPAIQRFMPDWLVEEFVFVTLQASIGYVPDERQHREQQDAADGIGGHLADGEPGRAQTGPAGLAAISPKSWPAPL